MEKRPLENDYPRGQEQQQQQPLRKKLFLFIRSNRYALGCALLILIVTIIVVPVVYTSGKNEEDMSVKPLSWDINGKTILNQSSLLNNEENNSFGLISSLKFDQDDNLYILDQTKHRILIYNSANSYLQLRFGSIDGINGSDSTSLNSPNDFYLDSDRNIYIADTFNHRILFLPSTSNESSTMIGTGRSGSSLTELNQPMSLTKDDKSNIYIADYGNNRILLYHFTLTETQVRILIDYNPDGERNSYVSTPISIRYSIQSNSLVIAQQLGFNVVRYPLDSSRNSWTLIAGSASSELNGTSRTLFNSVCSTEINSRGNTYVVDCQNERIQYYLGDLVQGKTIAGVLQAKGNNSYIFDNPTGIALDSLDNLFVADSNNYRIQKFLQLH